MTVVDHQRRDGTETEETEEKIGPPAAAQVVANFPSSRIRIRRPSVLLADDDSSGETCS